MLILPEPIMTLLIPFEPIFRRPTWLKAQILFIGAIIATGKRTVTAALRVMGVADDPHFSTYHQVLNRAVWSPRRLSEMLLALLMKYLEVMKPNLVFITNHQTSGCRSLRTSATSFCKKLDDRARKENDCLPYKQFWMTVRQNGNLFKCVGMMGKHNGWK